MNTDEMRRKFAEDLIAGVKDGCREGAEKVVLLSGGVDSLTCLVIAIELWGLQNIRTVTIAGMKSSYDYRKAISTARYYGVRNDVAHVTLNDMLPICRSGAKGTGYGTVFQVLVHAALTAAFEKVPINGADVINGEGADGLYGSTGSFAYMEARKVAEEKGIPKEEALTLLRWKELKKQRVTAIPIWTERIENAGGHPVMPFLSAPFGYIKEATFGQIRPKDKKFARDLLVREFGVPVAVARRRRMNMQSGTGLYELLGKELVELTGANSPNGAVKELCA